MEISGSILPLLQAGGNLSTIAILFILFKMYNKMKSIEQDVAVAKNDQQNTKNRVDTLERKVFNGALYVKEIER